jgi:CRP/FNR family cyclic AMP-dependent transcriptional regulator
MLMPAVPDPSTLGEIPLFRGLTLEQLSRLNTLLHRKTFPAGTTIMTVDQPGEAVYVILTGTLKIHVEQANSTDVILAILGPGEIVGELSVIDTSVGRSATVVTLESATLLWMDRTAFVACLERMPGLSLNLARILVRRLRLANAQIQALATLDVYGRVARQLLAFAEVYGEVAPNGEIRIPLRLTQSDLAGLVGASRVRVNQVLATYKQRRLLSVDRNFHIIVIIIIVIIVHDVAALREQCS